MKKIIITGGLGYIGSELCKIYSGYSWNDKVIVIDNRFISERVNQLRKWNMEFIHGDILDKELVKKYKVIEATFKRAEYFVNVSRDALAIFPNSREKNILQSLSSFSLNRSF